MNYLKKFEYFDNEADRDANEIPWMRGEIRDQLKKRIQDESIYEPNKLKSIIGDLTFNVPFLKHFMASGDINKARYLSLGNFGSKEFDEDNIGESNARIHIDINTDGSYVLQFECKVIGNGQILYQDRHNEPLMNDIGILKDVLVNKIYPKVKTWAKWTKSSFGHDPLHMSDKEKVKMQDGEEFDIDASNVPLNPQLNSIDNIRIKTFSIYKG